MKINQQNRANPNSSQPLWQAFLKGHFKNSYMLRLSDFWTYLAVVNGETTVYKIVSKILTVYWRPCTIGKACTNPLNHGSTTSSKIFINEAVLIIRCSTTLPRWTSYRTHWNSTFIITCLFKDVLPVVASQRVA